MCRVSRVLDNLCGSLYRPYTKALAWQAEPELAIRPHFTPLAQAPVYSKHLGLSYGVALETLLFK